jgi:hypothetical protein
MEKKEGDMRSVGRSDGRWGRKDEMRIRHSSQVMDTG